MLALLILLPARALAAQDFQKLEVGSGVADTECVLPGVDGTLESTPTGDDKVFSGKILSGPNGVCETTAALSDTQALPVGNGTANSSHILSGTGIGASDNGICDNVITYFSGSDDGPFPPILPGQSTPYQVAIAVGINGTLQTTPSGDDTPTSVICPGVDGFQSSLAGDDVLKISNQNCVVCASGGNSCILPGPDGVLDTTTHAQDIETPVISSGPDGICQTTAAGDDIQRIPVGEGFSRQSGFFETTVCADTGGNGIAESTLCGNGVIDLAPGAVNEACDDGDLVDGDGCDSNCTLTACGNGIVTAGETCDDGNTSDNDTCLNTCVAASCPDGFTCSATTCTSGPAGGPEECDDGNGVDTDACSNTCELGSFCGDGITDPGEQCDDGNGSNNDTCLVGCILATCGDGFRCSNAACTSGPGGGPEQCDPPASGVCAGDCSDIVPALCGDGVVNGNCTAGIVGNACTTDPDCDTSLGAGDGVCLLEECDDGNSSNRDGCLKTCKIARCGDGFVFDNGGPEECDDGNTAAGDGCTASCLLECGNGALDGACSQGLAVGTPCTGNADCDTSLGAGDGICVGEACDLGCGKATIDGQCTAGLSGACAVNADCDTILGGGDGRCQGSTCGPGCTLGLTAATAGLPGCIAGTIGSTCGDNADCDTSVGSGDGVCRGPSCNTTSAIDLFCDGSLGECSQVCQIASCGNSLVECDEECDLGVNNGVANSGCDANCQRAGLVGRRELDGPDECPSAFTMDNAPDDLRKASQRCDDNDPSCDFNTAAGTCTFRVGVCLNREDVPNCTAGFLKTFELRKVKVLRAQDAAATEAITNAVKALSPSAILPDRCRKGAKNTTCSIPDDYECDSHLGSGNGRCDLGTGVVFLPWVSPASQGGDQVATCTPSIDIDVAQGTTLKFKSLATRLDGKADRDKIRLKCN